MLVVGKGLLAGAFEAHANSDHDFVVFASGVSKSSETRAEEFARERDMLAPFLSERRRIVYFGSCGSATGDEGAETAYMRHKRDMENRVLDSGNGVVLRLPQVVGRTANPYTLTNFLHAHIISGRSFTVWSHAERNLVDVEDVVTIGTHLVMSSGESSHVFSIAAARSLAMPEIIAIFERVLKRSACCSFESKGTPLQIEAPEALAAARLLSIDLGRGYAESIIRKYYEHP